MVQIPRAGTRTLRRARRSPERQNARTGPKGSFQPAQGIADTTPAPFPLMTPYEQELRGKYLAYLNSIGYEGDYPDFEA